MDGQFKHSSTEKRSKRLRLCRETDSVEWCKFKIILASVLNANTQTWMHGYYRKQSCSHSNSECAYWLQKKAQNYTRTHICLLCMAHSFIGLCVGAICGFLVAQKKLPSSTVALITFHEKEKGKVRSVKVWLGTKLQPAAYFILAQAFKDHHASLSGDLHPLPCLAHASCFSSPSLPLSFPVPFCFSSPLSPPLIVCLLFTFPTFVPYVVSSGQLPHTV